MSDQVIKNVPLMAASLSEADRSSEEIPYVLSYFAQRRAAGYIGLALPLFVVLFDQFISRSHCLPSSISASYYTGIRNFFIGSLCAVGIFLISSIGYKRDIKYTIFAGVMAFLVAFDPCRSSDPAIGRYCGVPAPLPYPHSDFVHLAAAVLLFLTFAFFCLVLFTRSVDNQNGFVPRVKGLPTKKRQRNLVFIICGTIMLIAMGSLAVAWLVDRELNHYEALMVEWICLWAFGFAWLVKGQQLLKDTVPTSNIGNRVESVQHPPVDRS